MREREKKRKEKKNTTSHLLQFSSSGSMVSRGQQTLLRGQLHHKGLQVTEVFGVIKLCQSDLLPCHVNIPYTHHLKTVINS